ncbi:hypothetical protein RINTHM_14610 [Richelia intracellularis HM01]|uniref:DUF4149 domain-containing protein n=1 Tax=Richelia intracellularis TaxID=1164990 RepID=UPI0002B5C445|nr:DUF4149 domain-containing protein [Richelia intracellularis]CCH65918.1 hypothetical protein RINTHM_14610 [Richelia intracellularis HM01]
MDTISPFGYKRHFWQNIIILTLGFWLSANLIIDWLIMPSLYVSGVMKQPGFIQAGYTVFWNFNRIELLCASLVLTGILVLNKKEAKLDLTMLCLAGLLLVICLVDTYILTPQMSAMGLQMNLWQMNIKIANIMNTLHRFYLIIEAVKLIAVCTLFSLYWGKYCTRSKET